MAISKITVSDSSPVNSVTVTGTSTIDVITVGTQGPTGPNTIFTKGFKTHTNDSSDNGAGIIYDHANSRWCSTVDSDVASVNFKVQKLILNSGVAVNSILDEDNMASDSATALVTQQSIKAYVDAQITLQDIDYQGDTGGAQTVDLDSQTLTFAGGTGIDTSGSGQTLTIAIDSTVATLSGTQTLTNKTLTSPKINDSTAITTQVRK